MRVHRFPYTARSLLLGLFLAQVIATIQVYLSNLDLYSSLAAIRDAGYLPIPNLMTMPRLRDFHTAFLGGLFFTFSVGAGLSIAATAEAWLWDRLFSRRRFMLIIFMVLWLAPLVGLNLRGFSFLATCYFLAIPPVVFSATLRWMPPRSGLDPHRHQTAGLDAGRSAILTRNPPKETVRQLPCFGEIFAHPSFDESHKKSFPSPGGRGLRGGEYIKWLISYLFYHPHLYPPPSRGRRFVRRSLQPVSEAAHTHGLKDVPKSGSGQRNWLYRMVHVVPVVLLTFLWTSNMDSRTFLDLRDYLLLSNPLGKKINAFYYDYTLYPAAVFKSLDQKLLKTCNLESIQEGPFLARMERELVNHDYLPTGNEVAADLKIFPGGNMLAFRNRGRTILQTTAAGFFSDPEHVLREFSAKSDNQSLFRRLTFLSLLFGFPSGLYVLFYGLSRFGLSFFLGLRTSSDIASILCFIAGIIILIPLLHGRGIKLEVKHVSRTLESQAWQKRVAALRVVERKGMEVGNSLAYQNLLTSPHITERYWLVKALAVSNQAATYKDLLAFMDDPHPNVVSTAFYALGQRGDRRAVGKILSRIQTSADWYNQWYAYKALRALGWKQTKLQ